MLLPGIGKLQNGSFGVYDNFDRICRISPADVTGKYSLELCVSVVEVDLYLPPHEELPVFVEDPLAIAMTCPHAQVDEVD